MEKVFVCTVSNTIGGQTIVLGVFSTNELAQQYVDLLYEKETFETSSDLYDILEIKIDELANK